MSVKNEWNMDCPACGDDAQIDIGATVYVRLCVDGTDIAAAENGNHEWNDDSTALCCGCGHAGTVRNFTIDGRGRHER
jgi:hypothetical protein